MEDLRCIVKVRVGREVRKENRVGNASKNPIANTAEASMRATVLATSCLKPWGIPLGLACPRRKKG